MHMGAGYLMAEVGPLVKINFLMPSFSSIITVREEWRKDYESILSSQVSSSEENREEVAFRLLRYRLNADTDKGKLVEKDFFDINLPQIQLCTKENAPVSMQEVVFGTREVDQDKAMLENMLLQ